MKRAGRWSLLEFVLYSAILLRLGSCVAAPLPRLNIDTAGISVAGQSAGADMAVQFGIAFSHFVRGIGVVAGQPYNCAAHYFGRGDTLLRKDSTVLFGMDCPNLLGCYASDMVPICYECPPGETTTLDHCKSSPDVVNLDVLAKDINSFAHHGLIDDPKYLSSTRVYLFQGTEDTIYKGDTTKNTRDLFAKFVPDAQLAFDNKKSLPHCWPQTGPSYSFGIHHTDDFDVVGELLQHIYGELVPPAPKMIETSFHEFSQTPYHRTKGSTTDAFAEVGWVYIPQACADGMQCRLVTVFHGCGVTGDFGHRNEDLARTLSTNRWAESNGMVVLWPSLNVYSAEADNHHGGGCWDVYGGSEAFAWKSGPQMSSVARMIEALSGANLDVSAAPVMTTQAAAVARRPSLRKSALSSLSPAA